MSSFLLRRGLPLAQSARPFSTSSARSSFAKMTLIGRLADTPEVHATSTGKDILRYVVGVSSGSKDNQTTSWFRITSFAEGAQQEFISGLEKGTLVYVEGNASMKSYTDAEGKPKSALNLVQQKLEVLSPKKTQ